MIFRLYRPSDITSDRFKLWAPIFILFALCQSDGHAVGEPDPQWVGEPTGWVGLAWIALIFVTFS